MSEFELLDNEFLIIKEETGSYSSPIASLGYSFYDRLEEVHNEITSNVDKLQVVVAGEKVRGFLNDSSPGDSPQRVGFGQTQHPRLNDYADGVDTIDFLLTLS